MSLHLTLLHHTNDLHRARRRIGHARRLVLALSLGWMACALAPAQVGAAPKHARRTEVVEVVERCKGAVVNIHSERTLRPATTDDAFGVQPSAPNRVNGMGTGIIIDPRGYIVTCQHVVEDVSLIRVKLGDGASYNAKVLARDTEADLAIIKIDAPRPLPVIPFGTSSDVMVGETVVAIGNAYGYEHTVSTGIVSAVKRDVTLNKEISYKALIQTDASINPGNSGGPLLNINGELIGVNVAIRAGAQGIGFAIPVDSMLRVAAELMSTRRRSGTAHGIVYRDRVDTAGGLSRSLLVERAEATAPGGQAGVQRGDVVLQVGDQHISCGLELERALLEKPVGEHVPLVISRNGHEQKIELVLASAEKLAPPPVEVVWRKLGLRFTPVTSEVVSRVNQSLHGGLAVTEVNSDSVAAKAGIQRGDILVGLHQWETITLENVAFVLTHPDLASFNPLRFYIVRSGQVHRGWLQQVE